MVSPRATAASTLRRDAVTAVSEWGAMATGTLCRATATTSAIDREKPSRVTVGGMRKGSYRPAIRDAKADATRGQGMLPRPLDFHSAALDASASTSRLPPAHS